MKRFVYNSKSFCLSTTTWSGGQPPTLSQFDEQLRSGWDSAMENGHFRYRIDHMKTRKIPGDVQYILQLNELRGIERRKPEYISSVRQPFNPEKFNFTKIKPGEILFKLCHDHDKHNTTSSASTANGEVSGGTEQQLSNGYRNNTDEEDNHLVLINVSPLEYGHVLLVPYVNRCLPQVLTEDGVRLGLEMILLSEHRGFRVGYNSLCAYASVNHLHLHGWYLDHQIGVEFTPVEEICSGCHVTTDWPAPGFVFQLYGSSVQQLARKIQIVVRYLQEKDVAHNLLMVRGVIFGEGKESSKTTVRVYVWPRASFVGIKNEDNISVFNPAVAELGGHVPMYSKEKFDVLTEEDILSGIRDCLLPDEVFNKIQCDIVKLLQQYSHTTDSSQKSQISLNGTD